MQFLYFLEGIRTPFLDKFFSLITHLGEETVFLAVAIIVFWCFSKYGGYYGIYRYSGTVPAAPNAYFDQCTFYPAHCQVKTAKTTSVNTLPCAKNTNGSVQVLSAEADQTLPPSVCTGILRKTFGIR